MKTEIVYILDRSGSMSTVWSDAFNGLNEYIKAQKEVPGECTFSLVLFDYEYIVPIDAQDLQEVHPVSDIIAYPRGSTALLDALGKTINTVGARLAGMPEQERPEKVIVVTMTDGYENASREYTVEQVARMVKHQEEKYAWEFIFMGAGVDAIAAGRGLGMKVENTANFAKTKRGFDDASNYASLNTTNYRRK